ncbi:membrane protease YdiL (CAAX protease family) [Variovorax boronicumulans]|uniref:CPBP family intramembrane glutamic endopeptidase n=1 Tax=Variovorax boronicumulans TaxID=436515 RepID=UPI00277DDDB2|nr:CPBP family intramembrane glutamic endopeptidase [Variovorax boronicumulans]MDQ0079947.1 membrane protease YdiL (CAAX protease family) [Variovorax boronicumulans]
MPSPKSAAFPSVAQAALLFVALFLCEFVIGAALRDANGWLELNTMQIGVLAAVLGNGCVFAVVMHVQKLTYRELFHQSPASARATLMLVVPPVLLLVPALLLTITSALNLLMRVVPLSAWEESMFSRMADGSIAAVLAVCVLAPLLEEMLFRGIVLRGFLQRYPRGQAIFMSALFFGAAHMNIYQFVVGFVMGTVLAWLYERTRSLIPCIALHAAYNITTLLLADWLDAASPSRLLWAVLLALAAAVCGVLALRAMLVPRAARGTSA